MNAGSWAAMSGGPMRSGVKEQLRPLFDSIIQVCETSQRGRSMDRGDEHRRWDRSRRSIQDEGGSDTQSHREKGEQHSRHHSHGSRHEEGGSAYMSSRRRRRPHHMVFNSFGVIELPDMGFADGHDWAREGQSSGWRMEDCREDSGHRRSDSHTRYRMYRSTETSDESDCAFAAFLARRRR
jgi:hypothetical protein